jgi:hypothetical protein
MEEMKQLYTEAIDMVNRLSVQDVRFRTYLYSALERMEQGLELNNVRTFRDAFADIADASLVLHFNIIHKRAEA